MLDLTKIDKTFENCMFIGDPHVSSEQPSTRHDDTHILDTVLDKLAQAAKISHETKSYVLIEGDLLHNKKENNISLLNRLIKVLQSFYYPPLSVIGNHEKIESEINHKDMITVLIQTGVIQAIEDNELTVRIKIKDQIVDIGGTNYGSIIPDKIKRSKKANKVIWLTHHNLMFQQYYPGCQPLKEIDGVDLAVNGHIHDTKPQVQIKKTTWWNTGNILRLSKDMIDHVPSVWLWNPEHHDNNKQKLIQIPLQYKKEIFKKNEVIESNSKQDFSDISFNNEQNKLKFIELIDQVATEQENNKTSDKDIVKEHMNNLAELNNIPDVIKNELMEMLDNVE